MSWVFCLLKFMLLYRQEENNNSRRSEHQFDRVCVCLWRITQVWLFSLYSIYTWSLASRLSKQTHTSSVIVFHFRTSHLTWLSFASLLFFPHGSRIFCIHLSVSSSLFLSFNVIQPRFTIPEALLFLPSSRTDHCSSCSSPEAFILVFMAGTLKSNRQAAGRLCGSHPGRVFSELWPLWL